jgi:hypothetical protein
MDSPNAVHPMSKAGSQTEVPNRAKLNSQQSHGHPVINLFDRCSHDIHSPDEEKGHSLPPSSALSAVEELPERSRRAP